MVDIKKRKSDRAKQYIRENINKLVLDVASEIKPPSVLREILTYAILSMLGGFGLALFILYLRGG